MTEYVFLKHYWNDMTDKEFNDAIMTPEEVEAGVEKHLKNKKEKKKMKRIKFSFSINQLHSMMNLDERSMIAQVIQNGETVDVVLVVEDELKPDLSSGDYLSVEEMADLGKALNDPKSYIKNNKGSIRGGKISPEDLMMDQDNAS